MEEPLSGMTTQDKPVKIEFMGKTYVWMCVHHKVALRGGGHSQGLGMECWEGMMFDYEEGCWHPDSSELYCPALMLIEEPTDEQVEECNDSWELEEQV